MVRSSMLSLVVVVLVGTTALPSAPPPLLAMTGYRLYSLSPRCGTRTLLGVYESCEAALEAREQKRASKSFWDFEVTTGSEGASIPGRDPVLYYVYTRVCRRGGWIRQGIYNNERQAKESCIALQKQGTQVEVVHDHAPKEVYRVSVQACRTPSRLHSLHVSLREACDAAEELRTKQNIRCTIFTGASEMGASNKGQLEYRVFGQGCKGNWSLITTTSDPKKVAELVETGKKDRSRVEVVQHFVSK